MKKCHHECPAEECPECTIEDHIEQFLHVVTAEMKRSTSSARQMIAKIGELKRKLRRHRKDTAALEKLGDKIVERLVIDYRDDSSCGQYDEFITSWYALREKEKE